MNEVFKVARTVDDVITSIYVFAGALPEVQERSAAEMRDFVQTSEGRSLAASLVGAERAASADANGAEIVLLKAQIHADDTIETVKRKIILHCEDVSSFDEIYMFARQLERLYPENVYQNLTQDGKLELTRTRLLQFANNVDGIDTSAIIASDKDVYDYDDVMDLNLDAHPRLVARPLGQKFVAVETTFPYTVDPYKVSASSGFDDFLVRFADSLTTTTNKTLLMESGPIHENFIHLCMAQDVLASTEARGLAQDSCARIYYPYLAERGIRDLADLVSAQPAMVSESAKMIGPKFVRATENVDMFYDVARLRTRPLETREAGIKSLKVVVSPEYTFNLPLDVVFKLLHASKKVPLIKYNPGKRQEKTYRLHADKIATNGKKIPSLPRSEIMKLVKSIGKTKSVAAYIVSDAGGETVPVVCEFMPNGRCAISAAFREAMTPEAVDRLLADATAPVIDIVREFLAQSGYAMRGFEGLRSRSSDVESLQYDMVVPVRTMIDVQGLMGCVSTVFSVVSPNVAAGAVMRYKRVSDYNEMDSAEAYIVESLNSGARDMEIVAGLAANFQLSSQEARTRLASFVSRLQLVNDAFHGSERLRVRNNPGFLTTMSIKNQSRSLHISVMGVNGVGYLDTIPVYLTALVTMTQTPWATKVPRRIVTKLCKQQIMDDDIEKGELVAVAEKPDAQQRPLDIVAEELTFEDHEEDGAPDMLDILMMSDDEESSSDDAEGDLSPLDDDSPGLMGGADSQDDTSSDEGEEIVRDVTGMGLANPNPFFTRMRERDPTLFLVENEGNFKSYSRVCPWNLRRQPVILTDAEKERIDQNHAGSYTNAIKYGTSPDKQFWYICPKYWSLRDGVSLTEEQAKSGEYGDIIPRDAKKVPPGGNVFQFSGDGEVGHPHPGFQKRDSHPAGKCIPCCFKEWDSPAQKKRREACAAEEEGRDDVRPTSAQQDEYVVGADKFPLAPGRYGYLPLALQKLLGNDNRHCQVSATNTALRPDRPCMLRFGVSPSRTQSFVAAVAAVWADENNGRVVSIDEMKEVIIGALDLDRFMALQNGNLVEVFDPEEDVDLSEYRDSKIYRSTDLDDHSQLAFLRKVVRSYVNYIEYLRDREARIDYTYLWDAICTPNPGLFSRGLNLAILALNQDDMTDNVEIVCPSNHYATTMFDPERRTAVIVQVGNYFEPVFQFEDKGTKFSVTRRFSARSADALPGLRDALDLIQRSMNEKCTPLPSMPRVYKFMRNIQLERLAHILRVQGYAIERQVLNYNGRVVAVLARKGGHSGMVPCYPSAPLIDLEADYKWFDEPIGQPYPATVEFLNLLHDDSSGKIPSKPVLNVVEDGMVVGVLTQTNQFVPISPPIEPEATGGLENIEGHDVAVVDKESITSDEVDRERVNYDNRVRLETGFFNTFRNTVRVLLGKFEGRREREAIEELCSDRASPYASRLAKVDRLLRRLVGNRVGFKEYGDADLENMGEVTSCYTAGVACDARPSCRSVPGAGCVLMAPRTNLINGQDNEQVYFGRLADELVRYSRIRSFMFQPRAFLAFSDVNYDLADDEVVLLQNLLTAKPDYFEGLVPAPINSFVKYNTHDTAEPLDTQAYTSKVEIAHADPELLDEAAENDRCPVPTVDPQVAGRNWRAAFPSGCIEMVFPNSPAKCSFDLIYTLIKRDDPTVTTQLTKTDLREVLVNEYMSYASDHLQSILSALASQGKGSMAKSVREGTVSLGDLIRSDSYFATNLDMWLLATRFNVPLVFYAGTTLRENGADLMVAYSDGTDEYYFVKAAAPRPNEVPNNYRLLVAPGAVARIPIGKLSPDLQMRIRSGRGDANVGDFLSALREAPARARNKRLVEIADQ